MTLTKINLTLYKEQLRKIIRDHASKCPGKKSQAWRPWTFRGFQDVSRARRIEWSSETAELILSELSWVHYYQNKQDIKNELVAICRLR